jgi:hypothetical protein
MDGCSCHCTASALTLAWDLPLNGQEMIQSTWAWIVYLDMAYMECVNKNYYVQVYVLPVRGDNGHAAKFQYDNGRGFR